MAPHTVIGPPGPLHLPRWSELWEAREVLWRFGQRDILLRYRQTLIGVAWVILQPIVTAGVFALVFGRVAQLPTGGIPYFLFGYVGTLLWTVFASTVNRAAGSLVSNQALVSKVFFPRLLVPLSTCVSVLVDFLVALVIGFGLLWWFGVWPGWAILTIPVWVTLCVALAMGIGLAAAAIMVRYRDVVYVLPWAVQTLLYASPVAYSLEAVPDAVRPYLLANPLTWVLEGMRWAMLGSAAPPVWQIVGAVVVSGLVLFAGLLVFQRYEREFADLI